jgi:hypothetical protein
MIVNIRPDVCIALRMIAIQEGVRKGMEYVDNYKNNQRKDLIEKIEDIIYKDAIIHNEYGEDLYVKNFNELAVKIVKLVEFAL